MAAAVNAIVGRTAEFDEVAARMTDARRERILEAARASADRAVAAKQARPAAAGAAESARQVENAARAADAGGARRSLGDGFRPALSAEVRSMLAGGDKIGGGAKSVLVIGQLIDAIRAYERTPRG